MTQENKVRRSGRTPWPTALALVLAFLAPTVSGCKRVEKQVEKAKKTVGVTLLTVQHKFYQDLRDGLEDEAKKHGYRLLISTAEFDPSRQANQIDEFLAQKVDALVVCPCDSRSVGASIAAANEAGVPVFTTHIASNNIQEGARGRQITRQGNRWRGYQKDLEDRDDRS